MIEQNKMEQFKKNTLTTILFLIIGYLHYLFTAKVINSLLTLLSLPNQDDFLIEIVIGLLIIVIYLIVNIRKKDKISN